MKYEINNSAEAMELHDRFLAGERKDLERWVSFVLAAVIKKCHYRVVHDHSVCSHIFKGGTVCTIEVTRILNPTPDELSVMQYRKTATFMCDPLYNTVGYYWEGNRLTQKQHDVLGGDMEELEGLLAQMLESCVFTSEFTLVFFPRGGGKKLEIGSISKEV